MKGVALPRWAPLGAALLVGCGGGEGHELVVYTGLDAPTTAAMEERFEAAHPLVDVRVVRMAPREALLRLSGTDPEPADVWWGAPVGVLADAAGRGLLAETHPSWAGRGVAGFADAHDRWHGTRGTPFVFAFNRDEIARSRMPRDWVDLFHPRWFQEVLLPDPQEHTPTGVLLGWWIVGEEDRTDDPEAGFDWLRRLDGAVADYPSDVAGVLARLRTGDGSVAVLPLEDVEMAMEEWPWLDYTVPESGSPFFVEGVAVLAASPAPPLAEAFVEGIEAQEVPGSVVPLAADYRRIEEGLTAWLRRWRQEIRGAAVSLP